MIAKPMTYMNNSGQAAKLILSALRISPNQVLVIHDDIDLPLGKIKIKTKGGDAGQLGIRSITENLRRISTTGFVWEWVDPMTQRI